MYFIIIIIFSFINSVFYFYFFLFFYYFLLTLIFILSFIYIYNIENKILCSIYILWLIKSIKFLKYKVSLSHFNIEWNIIIYILCHTGIIIKILYIKKIIRIYHHDHKSFIDVLWTKSLSHISNPYFNSQLHVIVTK